MRGVLVAGHSFLSANHFGRAKNDCDACFREIVTKSKGRLIVPAPTHPDRLWWNWKKVWVMVSGLRGAGWEKVLRNAGALLEQKSSIEGVLLHAMGNTISQHVGEVSDVPLRPVWTARSMHSDIVRLFADHAQLRRVVVIPACPRKQDYRYLKTQEQVDMYLQHASLVKVELEKLTLTDQRIKIWDDLPRTACLDRDGVHLSHESMHVYRDYIAGAVRWLS